MPGSSQATSVTRLRQAPRDLTLRTWPLVDAPSGSLAILAAVLLVGALAAYASGEVASGIVIGLLLLAALWRIWIPVRWEIGAAGITQHLLGHTRRTAWSAIGSVERLKHGLIVSRDFEPGPLARLRGVYLPYNAHRTELLALFEFYLAGRANSKGA